MIAELQKRYKAVELEINELSSIPGKEALLEEKIAEGNTLLDQIEGESRRSADLQKMRDRASKSAGMLSLASAAAAKAEVVGFKAAGESIVEKSVLVNDEGEGVVDERTMKTLRDPDYSRAFKSYLRLGIHSMTESKGLKILQEGSDPAGGFLVPEDLLNRIIQRKPTPTRVAARTQQFGTSRDTVVLPKVNYTTDSVYTTGMRVTWGGESPTAESHRVATEPVFGQTRIPVFTAMMSLPVTNTLVEDTSFGLIDWLTGKFSETNELLRDNMVLNGSGSGQPSGILVNPNATDNPATTNSGVADAVSWEGLQNITWAIPEQYDEGVTWVFNRASTGLAISKLVDGDGRPLWTNGVQDTGLVGSSRQTQLLGYPVMYSSFMPDIAADAYPAILGDLGGYYLVNRVGFSIQVLREVYAENDKIVLLGRVRFGGLVAEPFRMRVLKVAA